MSNSFEKFQKRRLISSYFSVVLSVSLVLFLLGVVGIFLIQSQQLSVKMKVQVPITIFLSENTSEANTKEFSYYLSQKKYIKSHQFVSKDSAAAKHIEVVGEDFINFLGFNPLQDSFDLELKSDYVQQDSLLKIEKELKNFPFVSDVFYDKTLINLVHENIQKITFWLLILAGVFTIIAILLINSSMRLSIYANRFIIKTMQMVGATKSFIRRPFVWRNIKLGLLSAIIAVSGILALIFYLDNAYPDFNIFQNQSEIILVLIAIVLVGIFISWFSTFLATQKYLNLKTDDLY